MHIIECNKPKHKKYNFSSDKPLSKQMNAIPMYNSCINKFSTSLFIGKQGSGKTSLAMSILEDKEGLYQVFDFIFLFIPNSSKSNLKNSPFHLIPTDQVYDELNPQNLSIVYNKIQEIADKNEDLKNEDKQRCLIIFDDVSSEFKNNKVEQILKRIIKNQRHLFCSSIYLMQSYYDMPKQLRVLCNSLFLFKMSKEVMYNIFEELIEIDKKQYDDLLKLAYVDEHDFLVINMNTKQLYKNYDMICFDDNNNK